MTTRQRRRIITAVDRAYAAYVKSLAPALWFRMNEVSGAAAVNNGTLGAAYNGTYTACTLGQAGKISPSSAALFDGATSKLTIPAGPYGAYAQRASAALVNVSGTGEGAIGTFFDWATSSALRFNFGNTLRAIRAAGTAAASNTATGLTLNAWTWLFVTYDDGGDRKLHVYKGINGALTEFGYSTQTAAVGALTDQSAVPFVLGNAAGQDRTLAGLYDEFFLFDRALTAAQMLQIVRLTGV